MDADSVDGLPEFQVFVTPEQLEQLVGSTELAALFAMPKQFDSSLKNVTVPTGSIFLRKYSAETRP